MDGRDVPAWQISELTPPSCPMVVAKYLIGAVVGENSTCTNMTDRAPRILLVQTSFLGDVILSTPLIEILRARYPDHEIWMVTTPEGAELVRSDPLVSGVLEFDKKGRDKGLRGLWRLIAAVRKLRPDRAFIVQRHLRSALIARLGGVPWRRGFSSATGAWLFTESVPRRALSHEVERNLSLLAEGEMVPQGKIRLVPPCDEDIGATWREWLHEREGAIVVAPGSAWATKRWYSEGYSELCRRLVEEGDRIVVIGAPGEREVGNAVTRGLPSERVENLCGNLSLPLTMRLVSRSAGVVCNDSMILHMASAFRIPSVAVFCSTVPEFGFGPWQNPRAIVVGHPGLSCRPCGRHGFQVCPLGTNSCMREVTPEEVFRALKKVRSMEGARS